MHPIRPEANDRVFAVADGAVASLQPRPSSLASERRAA
jgi:hypothetical protein